LTEREPCSYIDDEYITCNLKRITFETYPLGILLHDNKIYIFFSFCLYRARTEQYGGAWCPLNQITAIPNEWLEIDFGNLTYLTQVETQGRFDNGRGKEYADYYILMYTRSNHINDDEGDDLISWIEYKSQILNNEDHNSSWIHGNQNTYMGEIRQLSMFKY
jgi:hypothetical protein